MAAGPDLATLPATAAPAATPPADRTILRGIVWGALFVLAAKFGGAIKEMAVAWRFGVSSEIDAYLFVFNWVTWPLAVWFAAASAVLVPLFARLRAERGADELQQLKRELFGAALPLGLLLAVAMAALLHWLVRAPLLGLPPETAAQAAAIVTPLAVLAALGVPVCLLSAWMIADQRYANTLFEGIPALTIALLLLTSLAVGIDGLVWATLIGFGLQLLALGVALGRRRSLVPPRLPLRSVHWSALYRGIGIALAANALLAAVVLIDQWFAAQLPAGAVATFGYANRILALLIGIGVTAVARATLPVFSATRFAPGDGLWRVACRWAGLLLLAGIGTAAIGWWGAGDVVALLFERGAFGAQDTQAVAQVLRHGLLQLPSYFAAVVLQSLFSAQAWYGALLLASGVGMGVKLIASAVLIDGHGLLGLQWSTAAMFAAQALVLLAIGLQRARHAAMAAQPSPLPDPTNR